MNDAEIKRRNLRPALVFLSGELIAVSSIKDRAFTTKPIATYHVTPGPNGVSALRLTLAAVQRQPQPKG